MAETSETQARIRNFLRAKLDIDFEQGIDAESDLFQLGLIDSVTYFEIIRFLESEFGVRLTNEEILSNVFTSLSDMTSLVCAAVGRSAGG
jgi:acyl carrier protein